MHALLNYYCNDGLNLLSSVCGILSAACDRVMSRPPTSAARCTNVCHSCVQCQLRCVVPVGVLSKHATALMCSDPAHRLVPDTDYIVVSMPQKLTDISTQLVIRGQCPPDHSWSEQSPGGRSSLVPSCRVTSVTHHISNIYHSVNQYE